MIMPTMNGLIDSHCHLTHENFAAVDKPVDIMARARAAGVGGALTISCRIHDEFPEILSTARDLPGVWCTVGTHPHEAGVAEESEITESELIRLATSDPKIIGIGETGLDYYYNLSDKPAQEASFRKHIRAAAATDLPLIIHARDADEDIVRILRDEGAGVNPRIRGVMHCFSSTRWLAEQALAIGFYISFSGILTFKKAEELREIAAIVPLDRILVETDSPYLAPEPLRGKVNEPAFMIHTLRKIAEIKNLDEQGAITLCNQNFFNLFRTARL